MCGSCHTFSKLFKYIYSNFSCNFFKQKSSGAASSEQQQALVEDVVAVRVDHIRASKGTVLVLKSHRLVCKR